MKSIGIVRKLDKLGRITLPVELRRTLGIELNDPVEIYVNEDQVVLKKYVHNIACSCCGESHKLFNVDGISLCKDCIDEFAKKVNINGEY